MDPISLGKSMLNSYDMESMNFLQWLNDFEHIVDFANIENTMKVTFLLSLMNPEAYTEIIEKVAPANPQHLPYEVLISHLEELFGNYQGEWAANYRFIMRDQYNNESVLQYINAISKLGCKVSLFLRNSTSLRVRFINGLKDIGTRNELRSMTNLTLESVVAIAVQREFYKLSNATN